ncbi:outer dense fiber protein 3-like [Haliotis rufescens]|uniref:outer dense fiber protein 3-like n=1 Tax=Haliotis rufescens TaxID=6454 RepID=UPI001EAF9172|nr:outer dense fiber protein 3-like [Haliotis rufescens]
MDSVKSKKNIPIAARQRGPGPGRYALPSTCGFNGHDFTKYTRPAYSFGRRLGDFSTKKECSPGPAYFINPSITRSGRDGTPAYSLLARQTYLGTFKTPSPRAYMPERVHPQGERNAPKHSIGARTRYRKRDGNPAPNKYTLPKVLGAFQPDKQSSPGYSMTARSMIGGYADDLAKAPGPGNYNATVPDLYKDRSPLYSLRRRSYMPGDSTMKPGPGAHCPERVVINRPKAAVHSLGIRHSEFICPLFVDISE